MRPGLPFLERLLPHSQYAWTRIELAAHPALRAAQAATGLQLGLRDAACGGSASAGSRRSAG
jgi:hypothetical protein